MTGGPRITMIEKKDKRSGISVKTVSSVMYQVSFYIHSYNNRNYHTPKPLVRFSKIQ